MIYVCIYIYIYMTGQLEAAEPPSQAPRHSGDLLQPASMRSDWEKASPLPVMTFLQASPRAVYNLDTTLGFETLPSSSQTLVTTSEQIVLFRFRQQHQLMCVYIQIYSQVYMYVYIYIYIYIYTYAQYRIYETTEAGRMVALREGPRLRSSGMWCLRTSCVFLVCCLAIHATTAHRRSVSSEGCGI